MDLIQKRIELLLGMRRVRLIAREALIASVEAEATESGQSNTIKWTVPLTAIPNEVADVIVDFLHDDVEALGTCCLVSRAFIPSSRYHLFKEVQLDDQTSGQLMDILSSPLCTISPFVHVLRLKLLARWPDETWKKNTVPHLHNLSNARALHLSGDPRGWKRHAPKIGADLLPLFAWLTELKIDGTFETYAQFIDVLCAWPLLEHALLGGVSWTTPSFPAPIPQHCRLAANLRSLELCLPNGDRILSWLLSQGTELLVHTLHIYGVGRHNLALINAFVRALGPVLKSFHLESAAEEAEDLDLSHNKELLSVSITSEAGARLRTLSAVLSRISSTNIEAFTFDVYVDINKSGEIDDIDVLRTLESPRFQHLRLLRLFVYTTRQNHRLHARILEALSSHNKRGVLYV